MRDDGELLLRLLLLLRLVLHQLQLLLCLLLLRLRLLLLLPRRVRQLLDVGRAGERPAAERSER